MSDAWDDPRVVAGLSAQMAARQEALDGPVSHLGWKVGFGAPASLELMQIAAPLLGYLTDATQLETGADVDAAGWERGIVEFETAVYIGSRLGPNSTNAEARAAISAVGAAIELANIDGAIGPDSVTSIMAGNIFHRAVILGRPDPRRAGLETSGLTARILVDGKLRDTTDDLEAITGPYPWIVSTVATTLAGTGESLEPGDVIITGSVIPPIPVTEGRTFSFELAPLDPISVNIA
ncbi:MAG: fumarylacetoacetate hydrolase family protein [Acidimicrobiia bacterium]|nr:fumarylacetoacetate hydrolase family protein [Acidimicrobiia bacterium]